MIARPEMIPKLYHNWSATRTANDPAGNRGMPWILVSWILYIIKQNISVTQYPASQFTQPNRVILYPVRHVYSYLGYHRLFMCGFRFWKTEILLSSMLKPGSKNSNGYSFTVVVVLHICISWSKTSLVWESYSKTAYGCDSTFSWF